jgi:monoamine oxidase
MTVHVVGAGIAGLAAALAIADRGHAVVLHEGAKQAGGRCRSWLAPGLDRVIDNGTHMVVGANHAVFTYLRRIGAEDSLRPAAAAIPMLDLASGRVWTATPLKLAASVLASTWQLSARQDEPIAAALGRSRHYRRFWDPLALAVMNTPADQASALVFRRVLARTLWRGGKASQPFLARQGLSQSFIAPALAALAKAGATLRLNHPLRAVSRDGGRVLRLQFDDAEIRLGADDQLLLAVPWPVAGGLLPDLPALPASPIVNAHFRLSAGQLRQIKVPDGAMLGLLGGTGQWLFVQRDVVSVTISGAGDVVDRDGAELGQCLWQDAGRALGIAGPPDALLVIKEKRATLFHTPETEARRPPPRQGENLLLAGDWTATGLPCTLEGAITSGLTAAEMIG